jgi:hypothetical protein
MYSGVRGSEERTKNCDTPWKKYTMSYNGEHPLHNCPSWMNRTYEVYYCDPHQLAHEIMGNSNFDGEFDYAAYQEFGTTGKWRFGDFMLANFAWRISVSYLMVYMLKVSYLNSVIRIKLLPILTFTAL